MPEKKFAIGIVPFGSTTMHYLRKQGWPINGSGGHYYSIGQEENWLTQAELRRYVRWWNRNRAAWTAKGYVACVVERTHSVVRTLRG